jgi:hypothetical protein
LLSKIKYWQVFCLNLLKRGEYDITHWLHDARSLS